MRGLLPLHRLPGVVVILDLFAGAGGWSVACQTLDLDVMGVDWDPAAVATARAAGHHRVEMDARALRGHAWSVPILIASPPCQTFSRAGKGVGRTNLATVLAAAPKVRRGVLPDEALGALGQDPNNALVLEPLWWAQAVRPPVIVLEQVPAVAPVWAAIASELSHLGYWTAHGNVSAECYGVPQTRRRAVLVASLSGPVALPPATHSAYRAGGQMDPGTAPWVSMASALGWSDPQAVADRVNNQSGGPRDAWWPWHRPATTVAGRGLVADPGANANRFNGATKSRNDGLRVTPGEAGVLQGFPADYPWSGGVRDQYRQVGNAIPPPLARAILTAALG